MEEKKEKVIVKTRGTVRDKKVIRNKEGEIVSFDEWIIDYKVDLNGKALPDDWQTRKGIMNALKMSMENERNFAKNGIKPLLWFASEFDKAKYMRVVTDWVEPESTEPQRTPINWTQSSIKARMQKDGALNKLEQESPKEELGVKE